MMLISTVSPIIEALTYNANTNNMDTSLPFIPLFILSVRTY